LAGKFHNCLKQSWYLLPEVTNVATHVANIHETICYYLVRLTQPNLTQPNLTQPDLTQPNLTQPNLTQPNLS